MVGSMEVEISRICRRILVPSCPPEHRDLKDTSYYDSTHNWLQHQFFDTSDVIRKPWIELCGDSRMEIFVGEQAPLHIAVCLGPTPVILKALSVPTKEINSDVSPLHLAVKLTSGAWKVLIAGNSPGLPTKQDQNGNTPLHEAVISGYSPMVVSLERAVEWKEVLHSEVVRWRSKSFVPYSWRFVSFSRRRFVALVVVFAVQLSPFIVLRYFSSALLLPLMEAFTSVRNS